jgi:HemY protein
MFRILFFLVLVLLLGLGFAWLADRPGTMLITFNGYQYQVTLMVAAAALVAAVAAVMILWWLFKTVWNSPAIVSRYFRVRRRDRGYQSLSTGLIAAGAGDAAAARKLHSQTAKLLSADQEPLVHLLGAQASLLEGDHATARKKFEEMLDDPEMRLIGLRGLFLEAERHGERDVARQYAERANQQAPQLAWAADAALEGRMVDGDWDGALRILDAQKASRQIVREEIAKQRAVLLTAKAISLANTDALASKNAALEANRLDPTLEPASVAAARALFKQDDLRKGSKILEAAWKLSPNPEIADLYVHARPGDATGDRLKRARKLAEMQPDSVESSLVVARTALEGGEFAVARTAAEDALRRGPREGTYLLLADIEEASGGSQGKVRENLAKAVRAPRDPAWTADGYVAERWAPFSPVTGRIGAFEWKSPVERIGQVIEQQEQEVRGPAEPVAAIAPVRPAAVVEEVEIVDAEPLAANGNSARSSVLQRDPTVPPPVPDDPGVDLEDTKSTGGGFRLF